MKVKNILEGKKVWYKLIDLPRPGKSSSDVEDYVSSDVDDIVKTIILKVGNGFYAFCVLKDHLVDYEKIKKHFNVKKARMANAEEVYKHSSSVPGGCCPLLVNCPIYFDPCILKTKKIHMGSGDPMVGLEVKTEDLINIVKPEILEIGVPK